MLTRIETGLSSRPPGGTWTSLTPVACPPDPVPGLEALPHAPAPGLLHLDRPHPCAPSSPAPGLEAWPRAPLPLPLGCCTWASLTRVPSPPPPAPAPGLLPLPQVLPLLLRAVGDSSLEVTGTLLQGTVPAVLGWLGSSPLLHSVLMLQVRSPWGGWVEQPALRWVGGTTNAGAHCLSAIPQPPPPTPTHPPAAARRPVAVLPAAHIAAGSQGAGHPALRPLRPLPLLLAALHGPPGRRRGGSAVAPAAAAAAPATQPRG